MGVQSTSRDIENLANVGVIPNTTNTIEINAPIKLDSTLFVVGAVTFGTPNLSSVQNGITAFSTGGQASAVPLTASTCRVTTVGATGDSVLLPAAVAGKSVTVINQAAANSVAIFPNGATDVIQGFAVQIAVLVAAGSQVEFRCVVAGTWSVLFLSMNSNQATTGTTTTTFAAGQLTGAETTIYTNTGNTPGSIATRTATQMFNETPNAQVGGSYLLRIVHTGTGTLTVTQGSGVTLSGATTTVVTASWREYLVTFTTATALTMVATGATGAAS